MFLFVVKTWLIFIRVISHVYNILMFSSALFLSLIRLFVLSKTTRFQHFCYVKVTFIHIAEAFIQSDLQMRTIDAIRINKRAIISKCYNKSQLAQRSTIKVVVGAFYQILFYV